jgi:hypothetical protein
MDEGLVPEVLKHDRMGHEMGGIAAVYSQVTPRMQADLKDALTVLWEDALSQRVRLNSHSPVPILDRLLTPLREQDEPQGEETIEVVSQKSPRNTDQAAIPLRPRRRLTA